MHIRVSLHPFSLQQLSTAAISVEIPFLLDRAKVGRYIPNRPRVVLIVGLPVLVRLEGVLDLKEGLQVHVVVKLCVLSNIIFDSPDCEPPVQGQIILRSGLPHRDLSRHGPF